MRRRTLPVLLACLIALACAASIAGTAYADDGERSAKKADRKAGPRTGEVQDYLAQLKPEELTFLREKVKGWDQLDLSKKQVIARNVVRIRNMPPEQRKQFEARLRHMRDKSKRWDRLRDRGSHMLISKGLAHAALQKLGRGFEGQLRRRDISSHVFEMSFGRTFWGKVAESALPEGKLPTDEQLTAMGVPEKMLARFKAMRAQFEAATKPEDKRNMRKRVGRMLGFMRANKLREELARSDIKGKDAYVAAVAHKVVQTWPAEFASSLEDREALLRNAENEEVRRSLRRLLKRDGKLLREEASLLVQLVDRWVASERKDGEAAAKDGDDVIKRVLRDRLRVPVAMVETLPPRAQAEQRATWLRRILDRFGGVGRFGRDGRNGRNGRDGKVRGKGKSKGFGPGGTRRGPRKPEGVSDAQWKDLQEAFKRWMRDKSSPLVKPDSWDQAAWDQMTEKFKRGGMKGRGRHSGDGDRKPGDGQKPDGDK